ncbi:MAG: type II toxin-antitoxin system Phd/YefM family antitoxin [Candidatus Latescibacterota bacterium]|jgi:prevent-host-death family protein|tara:strand:- start:380 stop:610 length:231 start_codon:yes stop_codon:yes gene_type:complete
MQIPAGEFKSKCLKLMDQVRDTHEEIVITKHGKPVVKVIPIEEENPRPLLGYLQGSVSIDGDITEPIDEVWEADGE